MAIDLITGLPGNSKTLFTIDQVIQRAEAEGRAVYYHGIKELTLDWTPIDPVNWMDAPPGSIIVIDECQKVFRNRSLGSVPPRHVTELEEHRHKGLDFYLITQHPSLIDPAVRRLTQTHRHMIRIFGMEASTVHKWSGTCVANPDLPSSRKDSEKTRYLFNKKLYGVYKSADAHTMKRSVPTRLKALVLLPLVILAAIWGVKHFMVGRHATESESSPAAVAEKSVTVPATASSAAGRAGDKEFDPVKDAERYVQMSTPRIVGLPQTAPKYDELTKPSRVPVPAACIQIGSLSSGREIRCKCYTQDGTPMGVEFNMCMRLAREGVFLDFNPEPNKTTKEAVAPVEQSPTVAKSNNAAAASLNGSQVVVMGTADPVPKLPTGSKSDPGLGGPVRNKAARAADPEGSPSL